MPTRLRRLAQPIIMLVAIGSLPPMLAAETAPFTTTVVADFKQPWAMSFLPDGRFLVTEKRGRLLLLNDAAKVTEVEGVPEVNYGGQGGLGDIVLHPDFVGTGLIYLSYAEEDSDGNLGAAVARARLQAAGERPRLEALQVIWRQVPKLRGRGHYGHRIAIGPDGYLYISSGERQKFDPAQDMDSNLGKILRLNLDGSVPADNPFAGRGAVRAQIWSLGHRNPLGLAFDADGRLWNTEMGPADGDELNLVRRGANYGYPLVSEGDHYDGRPIPAHATRPEFEAPVLSWVPGIAPAGLMFYAGSEFPAWRGNAFVGGLAAKALIRIELDGEKLVQQERYDMGARIRSVVEGPDGALWLLEDGRGGSQGRLLRLSRRDN